MIGNLKVTLTLPPQGSLTEAYEIRQEYAIDNAGQLAQVCETLAAALAWAARRALKEPQP